MQDNGQQQGHALARPVQPWTDPASTPATAPLAVEQVSANRSRALSEFVRGTGLAAEHVVASGWGYPCLPLPQWRQVAQDRWVAAPDELPEALMGHPIYWLDPELCCVLLPTEGTSPDRWLVRQWFLLGAFGVWGPNPWRQWVDVPRAQGIAYTPADVRNHLRGRATVLDGVRRLEESQLHVSMRRVLDDTWAVLEGIDPAESQRLASARRDQLDELAYLDYLDEQERLQVAAEYEHERREVRRRRTATAARLGLASALYVADVRADRQQAKLETQKARARQIYIDQNTRRGW